MKPFVRPTFVLLAVVALACQAAPPDSQSPAGSPAAQAPVPRAAASATASVPAASTASKATDALTDWINAFFPWGVGQTSFEEVHSVRLPGTHTYIVKRTFTNDPRMNDQATIFVEDSGQVLVGDSFFDEDRAKNPAPVRTDADLASMRAKVRQYLMGGFSLALDPASDRKNWKGVTIRTDTGYGSYPMSAFIKADDGTLLVLGRFWDRKKTVAEQRKEMIKLAGVPATGPADARVTVVEYSDMQCGFCKRRTSDFDALVAKLGKELKIRRYIKSYPLTTIHPWAYRAASAGRCFFDLQGTESFFAWKSQVYARQDEMTVPGIDSFAMDYAYANEIPDEKFRGCYLQAKSNDKIHSDLTEGWALRVRSTPTYFIDGAYVSWFADNLMEEFLRTTYLGGKGLPLPAPPSTGSPAAPAKH